MQTSSETENVPPIPGVLINSIVSFSLFGVSTEVLRYFGSGYTEQFNFTKSISLLVVALMASGLGRWGYGDKKFNNFDMILGLTIGLTTATLQENNVGLAAIIAVAGTILAARQAQSTNS